MILRILPALLTVAGVLVSLPTGASSAEVILAFDNAQLPEDEPGESSAQPRRPTIALSPKSDSGLSKSDRITSETGLLFEGEAKPGSTVVITEKSIGLAQGVVSKEGRYEIALPKQKEGTHTFAAAQLTSPTVGIFSKEIRVVIDRTAPKPPRLDLASKPKTFKNGEAVVSGSVSERRVQLRIYEGKKLLAEASPENNRSKWFTEPFKVTGGTHIIHAVAIDQAGNVSKPSETAAMLVAVSQRHVKLGDLDRRTGITLTGADDNDEAGYAVSGVGDVNGDGLEDVAIGAPGARAGRNSPGVVYLLFGSRLPFPAEIDLSKLDGRFGVTLQGGRFDRQTGGAIAPAGDVNDDGIDDMLVGVPDNARAYIVFGRRDWPAIVEMSRMVVGEGVEVIPPVDVCIGGSLAGGGDVNGDGIDDMAFSCGADELWFDRRRGVFVVYGRNKPFPRILKLDELDGRYGSRLNGERAQFGFSVTIGSDLNNDGIDDVIISEPDYQPKYPDNFGRIYVLNGKRGGYEAVKELGKMTSGEGFYMTGELDWRRYGRFLFGNVSSGGDLNADGIEDIVVSTEVAGVVKVSVAGFVIFGHRDIGRNIPSISQLDGSDGFRVDFNPDGTSRLSIADDINRDGMSDLLGGFPGQNNAVGTSIVMHGKKAFPPIVGLAAIPPQDGYVINGQFRDGFAGASVSGIGDFNGDGIGDIAIGAPQADGRQRAPGMAYIVYGKAGR